MGYRKCITDLLRLVMHVFSSFFHISEDDEDMYRRRGEISPQVVDRAVRKTLAENHSLIGARHYCKVGHHYLTSYCNNFLISNFFMYHLLLSIIQNPTLASNIRWPVILLIDIFPVFQAYLHGLCTKPNCQLRHLSTWEYADVIFYELLDEFQYLFGTPESGSFPILDSMNSNNPSNMNAVNDESDHIRPLPLDLQPERKRIRLSPGNPGSSVEDKRWDNPIDNESNQTEFSGGRDIDTNTFMKEIILLRNDNMELTRKAEMKIEKLREELSKLAQANSKLCADSNERSDKYNAEIQLLISAKTTLVEEKRGLQKTVQELEHKVGELQRAVDETEEKKKALVQMMVQRNVELTKNLTKKAEKSQETVRELESKVVKLQEAFTVQKQKAQQPLKELERKNAELQKSLTMERQKSEEVLKELESKNKQMHDAIDQRVKEAVKRYEEENRELHKTLNRRRKTTDTEMKKKLEVVEKKLADSRDSFSNLLRESEHRRSQIAIENEELKKKMHMMHDEFTAWKKMQEISNKPGYRPRNSDGYSWSEVRSYWIYNFYNFNVCKVYKTHSLQVIEKSPFHLYRFQRKPE